MGGLSGKCDVADFVRVQREEVRLNPITDDIDITLNISIKSLYR